MLTRGENVRLAVLRVEIEAAEAEVALAQDKLRALSGEALKLIERKWSAEPLHDLMLEDAYVTLQELQSEASSDAAWQWLENYVHDLSPYLSRNGYQLYNMTPSLRVDLSHELTEAEAQQLAKTLSAWTDFIVRHRDDASNEPYERRYRQQFKEEAPLLEYVEFQLRDARESALYLRVWPDSQAVLTTSWYDPAAEDEAQPEPLEGLLLEVSKRKPYLQEPPF